MTTEIVFEPMVTTDAEQEIPDIIVSTNPLLQGKRCWHCYGSGEVYQKLNDELTLTVPCSVCGGLGVTNSRLVPNAAEIAARLYGPNPKKK